MALSEFKYNKKRKHYSYIFGQKGNLRKNLVLTSEPTRKKKKRNGKYKVKDNVKLFRHPNSNKNDVQYIIPKIEFDDFSVFGKKKNWSFHPFDRRKIKRIKKGKIK